MVIRVTPLTALSLVEWEEWHLIVFFFLLFYITVSYGDVILGRLNKLKGDVVTEYFISSYNQGMDICFYVSVMALWLMLHLKDIKDLKNIEFC